MLTLFRDEWDLFLCLYPFWWLRYFLVHSPSMTNILGFVCYLHFCGMFCIWNHFILKLTESIYFSLLTFKLAVNIILLGFSCHLIDDHKQKLEEKVNKALGGQSTSLPASRHNSVSDLTILEEDEKLMEIKEKMIELENPNKQAKVAALSSGTRSTPHSPSASPRNSLEDITEQLAMVQNTLDSPIILSDSIVSLVSMNDGQNFKLPEVEPHKENAIKSKHKLNSPRRKLFSFSNFPNLKRRVSLQELPNNVDLTNYADSNADKQMDASMSAKSKASWHLILPKEKKCFAQGASKWLIAVCSSMFCLFSIPHSI